MKSQKMVKPKKNVVHVTTKPIKKYVNMNISMFTVMLKTLKINTAKRLNTQQKFKEGGS